MEPRRALAPLPRHGVAQIPWRDEVSRPLVLCAERSATARTQATDTHPETVGQLTRRGEPQGRLGLVPAPVEVVPPGRRRRGPETVGEDIARLTGLYTGLPSRALARSICDQWGERMDDTTVTLLWPQRPGTPPRPLPLLDSHSAPERSPARLPGRPL